MLSPHAKGCSVHPDDIRCKISPLCPLRSIASGAIQYLSSHKCEVAVAKMCGTGGRLHPLTFERSN